MTAKRRYRPRIRDFAPALHRALCEWELSTRAFAHATRPGLRTLSNLRKAKAKLAMAHA